MRRVCRQSALVAFIIAWATAVLATPPRIVPFIAHGDQIMNVWVSEDQQLLLTYSQDSLLKIWQITSRRLVQTFDLKLINIQGFAIAPSGKLLVGKRPDGSLQTFDFETGQFQGSIGSGLSERTMLAIAPDGSQLVSADQNGALRLWDMHGGGLKLKFGSHSAPVQQLVMHPKGDSIVVAYQGGAVWQWNLTTGRPMRTFLVRGDEPKALAVELALSPGGERLVSRMGSVMKIWNFATGQLLRTIDDVPFGPGGLAVDPSGTLIYSDACRTSECAWENDEGRIEVRDIGTGALIRKLDVGVGKGTSFAFSSDGQKLFHGSVHAAITVWDTNSGQRLETFGHSRTEARDVAITPDGSRFVLRLSNGRLQLWSLQTGRKISIARVDAICRSLHRGRIGSARGDGSACRLYRRI